MKKILLTINGKNNTLQGAEYIAKNYNPNEVEIEALAITEDYFVYAMTEKDRKAIEKETLFLLNGTDNILKGYKVNKTAVVVKNAGEEIVNRAKQINASAIVMAKPNKNGVQALMGTPEQYVAINSDTLVYMVA